MRQIELYVPTQDNQGKPISSESWQELEWLMQQAFQGFTTYEAWGRWVDSDGLVATEPVRVHRIVCQDDQADQIPAIAAWVKQAWRQESVLYTVQDVQVTFI